MLNQPFGLATALSRCVLGASRDYIPARSVPVPTFKAVRELPLPSLILTGKPR
jgi:hypothetical protein